MKKMLTLVATLTLTAALPALAAQATVYYIKDVMLIGGTKDKVNSLKSTYQAQGWTVIDYDLNKGCGSGSDYIYLLYKAEESQDVNLGYITGFYIKQGAQGVTDTLTHAGRVYHLAAYDGSDHFISQKGDLNSNAGGDCIHLYYTRANFSDNRIVTDIVFNTTQSGAVGKNGGTTGYDLNAGCGPSTDDIYMHIDIETAELYADIAIGDGTSYSYNTPFKMHTPYSLTEHIYTAEEIGLAGTITSISFLYASSGAFSMSGVQVYLKHTDKNNFADRNMVPLSAEDKVFEGTFSATGAGWATITLDTPFMYDGYGNLLVGCYDPSARARGVRNGKRREEPRKDGILPNLARRGRLEKLPGETHA